MGLIVNPWPFNQFISSDFRESAAKSASGSRRGRLIVINTRLLSASGLRAVRVAIGVDNGDLDKAGPGRLQKSIPPMR